MTTPNTPDPKKQRCPACNPDGMNRTGLMPVGYVGSLTSVAHAIECPNNCNKGLRYGRR